MPPPTESVSARHAGLDQWVAADAVAALVDGHWASVSAARAAAAAIGAAVEQAAERLDDERATGRLIYTGAGSSARIAVADMAELSPTFGWPDARSRVLMAGGAATASSESGLAEDDVAAAAADAAAAAFGPADVVLGLAASGNTPYTIEVLRRARAAGALSIAMSNNPTGRMLAEADVAVVLDSGAEVLAGSTRLAAGSAQKIALNSFSTALMARLGGVYRGCMVGMQPTNDKLLQRAVSMVAHLAPSDEAGARAALERQHWHIKRAITDLWAADSEAAPEILAAHGHNLRRLRVAIDAEPAPGRVPNPPAIRSKGSK